MLQYNPPYTLPWVRRNEVLLSVEMFNNNNNNDDKNNDINNDNNKDEFQ